MRVRDSGRTSAASVALIACLLGVAQGGDAWAQNNNTGNMAPTAAQLREAHRVLATQRGEWRWGIGVPLLRLGVSRRSDEPGYRRSYEPELQWLNPQLTLQVSYAPNNYPWRRQDENTGQAFQAISVSLQVIAGVNNVESRKSELALGVSIDFLDGVLGVGIAVDLYRGVPVLGGSTAGGDVVPTGLFSRAFTRNGEFTVENVFFLLNINFAAVGALVGS